MLTKKIPYMNKTLKSAVYKKKMLNNKFEKKNNKKNLDAYRVQRFATFTKKLLRVSQTSFWSVTIVLFSCSIVSF
jgi:hypothetical protein